MGCETLHRLRQQITPHTNVGRHRFFGVFWGGGGKGWTATLLASSRPRAALAVVSLVSPTRIGRSAFHVLKKKKKKTL